MFFKLLPRARRRKVSAKATATVTAGAVLFFGLWSVAGPPTVASAPANAQSCPWVGSTAPIATRVEEVMAQMTESQELAMVDGGAGNGYAGNIPAIASLCIPSINLEDGPQGVGDGQCCVTQLPAPVAAASSWDTSEEQQYGAVVGSEEAGKGANVNLGPTINIVRDPRWGRAFETFSEDPYLAGQMASAYVTGVQSQGIMDQVKHYAVYNNETNRNNSSDDDVVQERAEQEIYMPAFQAAVNAGVDSVMCAYSQPNGVPACQNFYLLGDLDNQFGFQGFVTSDWFATQSTVPSMEAGDDMDMPGDTTTNYGTDLAAAIPSQLPQNYLDDAVERILTELFNSNVMNTGNTGCTCNTVTTAAHVATALQVAEEGTVLLKNSGGILPLNASSVGSIAVIGPDASESPTYSGGGSASTTASNQVTPLAGIEAAVPSGTSVTYTDGTTADGSSQAAAVSAAEAAKVAIIFVDYTEAEGSDLTSIDLGTTDDDLIEAVAAGQPDTIVVLNTGSAVTMPWESNVPGIVEQWYPGQVDGTAAAAVLFGTVDPSGHLPVTFPTSVSQVPASTAQEFPGANGQVDYNEGIDVGYRWYQSQGLTPLFPFGFGLSYTTFSFSNLSITGFNSSNVATVSATVTNTGSKAGADVAQLYVGDPASTGEPPWQLKGFDRVSLNAGASTTATFSIPVHDLTYWAGPGATSYPTAWTGNDPDGGGWAAPAGSYAIGVGDSSANLPLTGALTLANPVGPDTVTLVNPGTQATTVGSTVSLSVSATDSAAGQTLTYTAMGLPGGLYLNPTTGVISGTALHSESDTVTVTATDSEAYEDSVSFEWTVGTAPVTTTTAVPGSSCNTAATGESQLNESGFVASTSNPSGDGAQNAITNAVNGTATSRFSTDTDQVVGQYYEVNMGSPQTFNEVEMTFANWATDYAPAYSVEVSNNGSSWTVVANCTGNGSPEIAAFPNQTDQYVEVVLTAADPDYWWSIGQFYVFANSATTTTTAPLNDNCSASTSGETGLTESGFTASAPVPTSSAGPQNPITNAVAGNTNAGRFTTEAAEAAGDQYIVNMGSAQTFNEIEMAAPDDPTDYALGYNVEVSPNGSTWTVVASCTGSGTPEIVSFPAQSDQYVEVVLTATEATYWWSIEYFYVYSSGTSPTTTTVPTTTTTVPTTTTTKATTTTTTASTTTTTPTAGNCSASTSGETALTESGFTATSPVPSSGYGAQNPITNAVTGNTNSGRYTTQAAEAVGDDYVVNMGSAQTFNEIEMAAPDDPTDYALGYNVEVSPNGSTWTVVASCAGSGTPEIVSFPAQSDQYLEVVLTANEPTYWWSIEYFYVYGPSGTTTTTGATTTTTTPTTTTTKATTTTTKATTTTTKATTTTTAATTTTTAPGANCSASTSGQTQLSESAFIATVSGISGATGVQVPITQAVSHDDTSRFTSGADEAVGMTYEVNMGSAQTVDVIEMYEPDYSTDYPRGFTVEVSSNGSSWATVATCAATAQPNIVSFPAHTDQYIEVVLNTANADYWWSMEQFLVY